MRTRGPRLMSGPSAKKFIELEARWNAFNRNFDEFRLRVHRVIEIMQPDHQHHRVGGRRQEADGLIEGSCVI